MSDHIAEAAFSRNNLLDVLQLAGRVEAELFKIAVRAGNPDGISAAHDALHDMVAKITFL